MALALDEVSDVDPLYLSGPEKAGLLTELTGSMNRLAALRAQVLAVGDDMALDSGARDAGPGWRSRPAPHAAKPPTTTASAVRCGRHGPGWLMPRCPGR
jgi:hypothetical protein